MALIRSGSIDPETGLPDPAGDVDFTISLADGRSLKPDLARRDRGRCLAALQAAAGAATSYWPSEFTAELQARARIASDWTTPGGGLAPSRSRRPTVRGPQKHWLARSQGMISGEDRSMVAVESLLMAPEGFGTCSAERQLVDWPRGQRSSG